MVVLLLATLLAPAAATAGQFFPDSRVEVSLSGGHMAYLGLGKGAFEDEDAFFAMIFSHTSRDVAVSE